MKMIYTLYKRKLVLVLLAVAFMLLRVSDVQGQTTVTVGGGAAITCPAAPTATWTTPPTGITFSNWSRGSGVTCQSSLTGLAGSGFSSITATGAYNAGQYFSVTISADVTHAFALTSITWLTGVTPSGACNFDIEYSNNGKAVTTFGTTGTSTNSNTFTGNVIVAAGTSITLYLIPWNTVSTNTVRWKNGSTLTLTTGKFWIGSGAGGAGTDLGDGTNWTPSVAPTASDACYMNFGSYTSAFLLTQATSGLSMNALNITMAGTSTSAITKVTINASQDFSPGALSIINVSSGSKNDEIDFNVTGGTTTCSSVQTTAGGSGAANPGLYINVTSNLICTGNWTSWCAANSNTLTYIKNSGTLTINGVDSVSNVGNQPIRFLVDNSPATTTFNERVKLGTTSTSGYNFGGSNTILLGGYNNSSTGKFNFNVSNDSTDFGYNMGTENFNAGTFLFTGTGQNVNSYSSDTTLDRTPGSFKIGTSIPATITFSSIGTNNALSVYDSLVVNRNSVFSIKAAVIPSERQHKATIAVKANAVMNIGANAGGQSSSLPTNYLNYLFDSTSTINFNGTTQNVYSGANYGNLTLSNTGIKKAGGSLTILGNVLIKDTAVFDLNYSGFGYSSNFTDSVCGNWINNSTDPSGGLISSGVGKVTIMFNGTPNDTLGGTNPSSFYGIRINKNAATTTVSLANNLTVSDSTTLNSGILNINGRTLTLNGITTGNTNGTISGSTTSALNIGGTANSLYFTQTGTNNNYLQNFTITGAATLQNALNMVPGNAYGTVTVNGSGKTLNANGFLTLKSDVAGDARVGISTGSISGDVTVERYIPAKRAWRFIAVPFVKNSGQTINAAWQEGQTNTSVGSQTNLYPGYGTEITYNGINGFDPNTTTNPSIHYWDANINNWGSPNSTTGILLSTYDAYYLFIRGSRAINLSLGQNAVADPTTLRMKGTLNENGSSVSKNYTAGAVSDWILVGNPYASSIDIANLIKNTPNIVQNTFYVWDPKISGTYGVGGYVTYTKNGNTVTMVPSGGSYLTPTTIIQSGQAFMLTLDNSHITASPTFNQSDKSTSETNIFGRQTLNQSDAAPVIYTNLVIPSGDSLVLTDGIGTAFGSGFSATVDEHDIKKLWGYYEGIAQIRQAQTLAIDFRPTPVLSDTIFYNIYVRQMPYALKIFCQNAASMPLTRAWLVDKYLNTKTEVNLSDTTLYNFTPNTDVNSYLNRFMLVLNRQLTATPVPVTKAVNQNDPDVTGVSKSINEKAGTVTVYPNPVTNRQNVTLNFSGMAKSNYTISIYSAKGEKLATRQIMHTSENAAYPLPLNEAWAKGVYTVSITNESLTKTINQQLVIR